MKIVILDGYTENPGDLSWDELGKLGELTVYERSSPAETAERMQGAEAVFTNKTVISDEIMGKCPGLKFIGVLATGVNIVDLGAAAKRYCSFQRALLWLAFRCPIYNGSASGDVPSCGRTFPGGKRRRMEQVSRFLLLEISPGGACRKNNRNYRLWTCWAGGCPPGPGFWDEGSCMRTPGNSGCTSDRRYPKDGFGRALPPGGCYNPTLSLDRRKQGNDKQAVHRKDERWCVPD